MMHPASVSGLSLEIVQRFVDQYPEKAVDILVRYCQDQRIQNEIISYVLQTKNAQFGASSPPNSLNITFGSSTPTSPLDSQHSGSPPPRRTLPHRTPSGVRSFAPLSPPRTSSSVASRSSKDESTSGEYILLLAFTETGVEECVTRMRTAPIKYSLIREDVIHTRKLNDTLSTTDEYVFVPHAQSEVRVSLCAKLTWRRPRSDSTHSTTFYVVPREMLDVDILLGYEDSGEGASEYPPTVAPQPQRRPDYILEEFNRGIRPAAPTPPAHSYHRSTLMYDGSTSATPVQQHQHFVETLLARQHGHAAPIEDARLPPHSPAATVLNSRSSRIIEQPQPLRPSASPASFHAPAPHSPADKIRMNFVWDKTPMNVWIDPRAPCESFFKTFQQLVESRKGIFDRATITIFLKKDKLAPDDESYPLCLDESELEADWDTTVGWLEENRREKPPHVYGRVQVGEG